MVDTIANILEKVSKDSTNTSLIDECRKALDDFNSTHEKTFNFGNDVEDRYNALLELICSVLSSRTALSLHFLTFLRLLSRDKKLVTGTQDTEAVMDTIVAFYKQGDADCPGGEVECLKCLCNWVYHSGKVRNYLVEKEFFKDMIQTLNTQDINDNVFYKIRLVFLISALDTKQRVNMIEYGALTLMLGVIQRILQLVNENPSCKSVMEKTLIELLKALFNLTFEISHVTSPQIQEDCTKLGELCRAMMVTFYPYDHKSPNEILTHIANLLINLPNSASQMLVPEIDEAYQMVHIESPVKKKYGTKYCGHDMTSIVIMLDALEQRIQFGDYTLMKEKTLTILIAFSYVCRVNRTVRKYLKDGVLPRLPTSSTRPEEQPGLRGKITKLMQTVDVTLKNMAADFFFTLCKENANRLVRYVGYGNAAGFLASRGLMVPGVPHTADGDYSEDEDSDNSDDEEKDPITGATAVPKEDLFANLSEQEKEQEIDNLISMTNRLKELNVIKPMAVKSDGTLTSVDQMKVNVSLDSDSSDSD